MGKIKLSVNGGLRDKILMTSSQTENPFIAQCSIGNISLTRFSVALFSYLETKKGLGVLLSEG